MVVSKVAQLIVSAMLLFLGFGLIGASVGFFVNVALLRVTAIAMMRKHQAIEGGRRSDKVPVSISATREIFFTIFHVAWRDGLVQLALYASTQATSLFSSIFLGLSETANYSILFQFSSAVYSFASAYPNSFFPAVQSAYAEGDKGIQRHYVCTGIVGYWFLSILGTVSVCALCLPLLSWFKPDMPVDFGLFIFMCLYLGLLNQHSIFCNYIVSMNEIPYMRGYIFAAAFGAVSVCMLSGVFGLGAWGIILGQALSQLLYNNWRWPIYLCNKIGFSYRDCLLEGVKDWKKRLSA